MQINFYNNKQAWAITEYPISKNAVNLAFDKLNTGFQETGPNDAQRSHFTNTIEVFKEHFNHNSIIRMEGKVQNWGITDDMATLYMKGKDSDDNTCAIYKVEEDSYLEYIMLVYNQDGIEILRSKDPKNMIITIDYPNKRKVESKLERDVLKSLCELECYYGLYITDLLFEWMF